MVSGGTEQDYGMELNPDQSAEPSDKGLTSAAPDSSVVASGLQAPGPAWHPETAPAEDAAVSAAELDRARMLARTGRRDEAITLCRQWAETCPEASVLLAEILTAPEPHATTPHMPAVRFTRRLFRLFTAAALLGTALTGGLIRQMCPPAAVLDGLCPPWVPAAVAFGCFLTVCLVLGWYHAAVYRITRWHDLADAPLRAAVGALGDTLLLGLPLLGPWLAPGRLRVRNESGRSTGYGLSKAVQLILGQLLALTACLKGLL